MFFSEIRVWSWIWGMFGVSLHSFHRHGSDSVCVWASERSHDERMNVRSLPPLACMPNLIQTHSLDITCIPEPWTRAFSWMHSWLHHFCTWCFKESRCWSETRRAAEDCVSAPHALEDTNRTSPSFKQCDKHENHDDLWP